MGQFSYKNEVIGPLHRSLSEQLVQDLAHVPSAPLLALAKRTPGGWSHRAPFLKNAPRLFKNRRGLLADDLDSIADHLPWFTPLLKSRKGLLLEHLDAVIETLGGPRSALLCVLWNLRTESREEALPTEAVQRCANHPRILADKPDPKALEGLRTKLAAAEGAPAAPEPEPFDPADRTLRRLQQDLAQAKTAREKEIAALKRQHLNELTKKETELKRRDDEATRAVVALADAKAEHEATLQSLTGRLAKAEDETARLRAELKAAREEVTRKAREIAEELLAEEIRPWLADARVLQAASAEVAKLRQLTTETVEKVRKAQRDADPFLAKEHELRQAIPQMEEMLKLLRRYQRTAGQALPEIVALEQRITEHVEKVRYELERRDRPADPFLERIAAKINAAEAADLKAIEATLVMAERSGLVDSRHADLYRRDIHRRRSYLADQAFHEHKPAGPLALLERAVAIGEQARLVIDANNFACLRQDYLGLRLATRKTAQGDTRFILDPAARQKVVQLLEKLAGEATGLLIWVSFDGQPSALKVSHPGVKVTFSRGGKADHDIMDLVAKDKSNDGPWFVVSDDIEVRDASLREGAYIIYNEGFVRLLVGRNLRP